MLPIMVTRLAWTHLLPSLQSAAHLHVSAAVSASPAPNGRVACTLIPGDGVGPEMMDSVQEVLQSMGAKIDFEEMYFSEVL